MAMGCIKYVNVNTIKKVDTESFGKFVNKGNKGSAQLSPTTYEGVSTLNKEVWLNNIMNTIPTMLKNNQINALTSPLNIEDNSMKLAINTGDNCTKCLISNFILYKDTIGL